ncbi:Uncharacterised protein [Clostridium fallax]|uniref:Uncharacterized protein n=2 Tax=Clostridium fallax TaxID=1533 RepID=A0A1M4YU69_9CLOT|nr:hypothetical protein SAMN05443638_13212 [Clostridium fallax]SQB22179.1 Uncharacterised protein [Clostridium fallax]
MLNKYDYSLRDEHKKQLKNLNINNYMVLDNINNGGNIKIFI